MMLKSKIYSHDVFDLMKPGGIFIIGDRFKFDNLKISQDYYRVVAAQFQNIYSNNSPSLHSIQSDLERQFEEDGDRPSTLEDHIQWMKNAGFKHIRSPFFSFACGVVSGVK